MVSMAYSASYPAANDSFPLKAKRPQREADHSPNLISADVYTTANATFTPTTSLRGLVH